MMVVITYDVATSKPGGIKRLRHVSKKCLDHGQRVQNSVFECVLNSTELAVLKIELKKIIAEKEDSLRIYVLGNHYKNKIEHFGVKTSIDVEGTLIF